MYVGRTGDLILVLEVMLTLIMRCLLLVFNDCLQLLLLLLLLAQLDNQLELALLGKL